MINSWGSVTKDNYCEKVKETEKYKHYRLELSIIVKEYLSQLDDIVCFLDCGSLMGAYRNGKMLPHDDDFDLGLYGTKEDLKKIYEYLKSKLSNNYSVRIIDTYCLKIEVFEKVHGVYELGENNTYHNVSLDIQLYSKYKNKVKIEYYRNNLCDYVDLKEEYIIPTKTIIYENIKYPCPNNIEKYLESHYGYLGNNAVFNKETQKYEKA